GRGGVPHAQTQRHLLHHDAQLRHPGTEVVNGRHPSDAARSVCKLLVKIFQLKVNEIGHAG
ncbi:MAG: hypothetical protein WAM83_11680, partial [Bradyrhizobium sp.]